MKQGRLNSIAFNNVVWHKCHLRETPVPFPVLASSPVSPALLGGGCDGTAVQGAVCIPTSRHSGCLKAACGASPWLGKK